MKIKANQGQKRNTDREGKKRPFQDDTALILAVMCIFIVAHAYVIAKLRVPERPQKIIITGQTGDMASAISQNLSAQRQDIEAHIKQFLIIPKGVAAQAALETRRSFFTEYGWGGYQQYLAEQLAKLAAGGGLRAEFVFGTQKYAMLSDGRIAFRAAGLYCFGATENDQCGPQHFIIELVMRGSIDYPEALVFDDWRVLPPETAPSSP